MAELEKHLGGHANITNVDHGALKWAMDKFKPKSFLDIGCGPGGMVELADARGLKSLGVDGDYTIDRYNTKNFLIHDYSKGPAPLDKNFDLGWSVEFVEHVYAEYIPNYIQSFQRCKTIIMSFAPPGHGGYHHVNEQTQEYWIDVFNRYNFKFEPVLTQELRNSSTLGRSALQIKKNTTDEKKLKKAFVFLRGIVFTNTQEGN